MDRVYCPACGAENAAGARFCMSCGTPITAPQKNLCPKCGCEVTPGAAFCSACGMKMGGEPEVPAKPAKPVGDRRTRLVEKITGQKVVKGTQEGVIAEDGEMYVSADDFFAQHMAEKQKAQPQPAPEVTTPLVQQPTSPTPPPPAAPKPEAPTSPPTPPKPEAPTSPPTPPKPEAPTSPPTPPQQETPVQPGGFPPPPGVPGPQPGFTPPPTAPGYAPQPGFVPPPCPPEQHPGPGRYSPYGWGAPPPQGWGEQVPPATPQWAPPPTQQKWGTDTKAWGANGVPAGWTPPTAPEREGADDYDDEDEEDDRISPMDYLVSRQKENGGLKGHRQKKSADEGEKKKRKKFKDLANADGYYDDRRPVDDDEMYDTGKHIQWVPLILGIAGIAIFAIVAIQLQGLF